MSYYDSNPKLRAKFAQTGAIPDDPNSGGDPSAAPNLRNSDWMNSTPADDGSGSDQASAPAQQPGFSRADFDNYSQNMFGNADGQPTPGTYKTGPGGGSFTPYTADQQKGAQDYAQNMFGTQDGQPTPGTYTTGPNGFSFKAAGNPDNPSSMIGQGPQNTGGFNRVASFSQGGAVGDDDEDDGSGGLDTRDPQSKLTGALGVIRGVLDYGRQKHGIGGQKQAANMPSVPGSQSESGRPPVQPMPGPLPPTANPFGKRADADSDQPVGDQAAAMPMIPGSQSESGIPPAQPQPRPVADAGAIDDGADDVQSLAEGGEVEEIPQEDQQQVEGAIPDEPAQAPAPDAMEGSSQDNAPQLQNAQAEQPSNPAQIVRYLSGADAAPPEQLDEAGKQVDPHGQMSLAERNLHAVANATKEGGPDAGFALMQAARRQYDHRQAFASAALNGTQGKPPDMNAAAQEASKANAYVLDGTDVSFHPHGDQFTATVKEPGGQPENIPLSKQAMAEWLNTGKAGQYDNVHDTGAKTILEKLSAMFAPTEAQAAQPARPGAEMSEDPNEKGITALERKARQDKLRINKPVGYKSELTDQERIDFGGRPRAEGPMVRPPNKTQAEIDQIDNANRNQLPAGGPAAPAPKEGQPGYDYNPVSRGQKAMSQDIPAGDGLTIRPRPPGTASYISNAKDAEVDRAAGKERQAAEAARQRAMQYGNASPSGKKMMEYEDASERERVKDRQTDTKNNQDWRLEQERIRSAGKMGVEEQKNLRSQAANARHLQIAAQKVAASGRTEQQKAMAHMVNAFIMANPTSANRETIKQRLGINIDDITSAAGMPHIDDGGGMASQGAAPAQAAPMQSGQPRVFRNPKTGEIVHVR